MPTIWLWDEGHICCGVGKPPAFVAVECTAHIHRIMVAAGLIDSRSEAERLIKGGGVSWRVADGIMDWQRVKEVREMIPAGWPCYIRVGNGNWRLTKRKDKPGWNQFPGIKTAMLPEENQTIDVWSEVWK